MNEEQATVDGLMRLIGQTIHDATSADYNGRCDLTNADYKVIRAYAERLLDQAAPASQEAAAGPVGWKLVPIEPTQAMCQEGQWKANEWPKFPLRISPIYQAMIFAAPQAPQPSQDMQAAQRYRWLRDALYRSDVPIGAEASVRFKVSGSCPEPIEFDAAIDRASTQSGE